MKSKRLHLILTILIAVSFIISACGQVATPVATEETVMDTKVPTEVPTMAPTAAPEPVTLVIYHNWGPDDAKGAPMAEIFAGFMAEYPYITLDTQIYVDSDIPGKVETEFVAGQEPDLVFTNKDPLVSGWLDAGLATPVEPLMTEFGFDGRFVENALDNWKDANGKLIAFPLEGYVQPALYNMKILDAAGVSIPTTTDEVIADTPKIKALGYDVFASSPKDDGGKFLWRAIWQAAMKPDDLMTMVLNGHLADYPDGIAGMEDFFRLKAAGAFPANVSGMTAELEHQMFYSGQAAIWTGGSWYWQELVTQSPDLVPYIKLAGIPLPQGSPYSKPIMRSAFTAKGVVVTANGAKKMDAVEKFIKYLYQPENIEKFVEQAGMIPPINDVVIDTSKVAPIFSDGIDLMNSGTVSLLPVTTLPSGVSYNPAITYAFSDGATAEGCIELIDKSFTDAGVP